MVAAVALAAAAARPPAVPLGVLLADLGGLRLLQEAPLVQLGVEHAPADLPGHDRTVGTEGA
eukprot:7159498-Pyramimonas_sp.AAC.1